MKLYEILLEDKKQVQEAPMGMLNTLGNKAMSKLGNARATGKLSTGSLANQLHKEFQTYLGKTGREATKDAVMGFLSSKGYPTQGAATIINTALKGAANAPAGPLANMKNTARGLVGKAKDAMVKQAGNIADKMKPGLKATPIDRTEPTLGDETPTTTSPADTTAAAPTKTGVSFNNQLGGGQATYNRSTGFDRNTMKNTSEPMDPKSVGGVPSTTNPTTAPKQLDPRDLNKNGEVDATEKSIARNKGKKKTPAKPVATEPVAVTTGKINRGNALAEAGPGVLPQNIIDKAILKAAQEAEIMNTKQGKTSTQQTKSANLAGGAPTDTDGDGDIDATDTAKSSSGGGFAAGLKKGFAGKAKAAPDIASLEQRIAAIEKKVGLA
jgi:hypothetical protein